MDMNQKFIVSLLIVSLGAVAFLAIQNYQLKKQVEQMSEQNEAVKITPINPSAHPDNTTEASPFDKPNVDPTANQYPAESPSPDKLAVIAFEKTKHDFGRINEGEKVNTVFKFKNSGKVALVIAKAQGSCGCTVPSWPQQPIKPGESGEIHVTFDSHGKVGQNEKTVTVTANTFPASTILSIQSTVIPQDK